MSLINRLSRRCFNSSIVCSSQKISVSTVASDLNGRDLVSFENHTPGDIKTLLWAALDLKQRNLKEQLCNGKSICMISDDPIRRIALSNAAIRLGASVGFLSSSEFSVDKVDLEAFGKTLASAANIVFIDTGKFSQENVETLANGCTVPVVTVRTSDLSPLICLSELMTLFEHYQYLRRLVIAYVGEGSDPILNTYALLLPKVGMHLHFLINGEIKGEMWEKGVKLSIQSNTDFKQFDNLADNLYRSHIVSTCSNTLEDFHITIRDTEEMDLDWTVLHSDVYKGHSISKEMMRSKQSLIWKSISNLTWIFQALIVSTTIGYKPVSQRPGFEGIP